MSKIIRSLGTKQDENKIVKIEVRDLFSKSFDEDEISKSFDYSDAKGKLIQERNEMLQKAQEEIEQQKQQFEQYRCKQLESIDQLKKDWEKEKEVLSQNAYEKGFQQGYEEGSHKARADMEQSIHKANETIQQAKINAEKYIQDQEKVILDLALKAAEKIIGASLEHNKELFLSVVKRGLKEAREMKEIKIYVSPTYYGLITQNRDELVELFPPDVPFLIFVNEDFEDTDCYIETNHGRIVVSIDEQLQELRIKLNEILRSKE